MQVVLRHKGKRRGGVAACRHEWAIATTPIDIETLLRALGGAVCPACGGTREIELDAR